MSEGGNLVFEKRSIPSEMGTAYTVSLLIPCRVIGHVQGNACSAIWLAFEPGGEPIRIADDWPVAIYRTRQAAVEALLNLDKEHAPGAGNRPLRELSPPPQKHQEAHTGARRGGV
jgi:hypothetical protein